MAGGSADAVSDSRGDDVVGSGAGYSPTIAPPSSHAVGPRTHDCGFEDTAEDTLLCAIRATHSSHHGP